MNERLFDDLAKEDFEYFSFLVNRGYFETTDFEENVSKLANSLSILSQVIERFNKESKENELQSSY